MADSYIISYEVDAYAMSRPDYRQSVLDRLWRTTANKLQTDIANGKHWTIMYTTNEEPWEYNRIRVSARLDLMAAEYHKVTIPTYAELPTSAVLRDATQELKYRIRSRIRNFTHRIGKALGRK